MIVSKFGGSITANTERPTRAMKIVKPNPARNYVISSAPGFTSVTLNVAKTLSTARDKIIVKNLSLNV